MWNSIFVKVILVVVLSVFLVQLNVGSALAHNAPDIDREETNNRSLPELPNLLRLEAPYSSAPEVFLDSPPEATPEVVEDLSTLFLRTHPQAHQRYDLEQIQDFDDEVYGKDKRAEEAN